LLQQDAQQSSLSVFLIPAIPQFFGPLQYPIAAIETFACSALFSFSVAFSFRASSSDFSVSFNLHQHTLRNEAQQQQQQVFPQNAVRTLLANAL
jgi:hypothetical protein